MKRVMLLVATVAAIPSIALARPNETRIPVDIDPPEKMSTLIVYGDDPCPQSGSDEIVVCARQPESERYRLPKRFRRSAPDAANESWGSKVSALEYVGRAGTPNSCSPVGTGGQTGCYSQFLRQSRDERRAAEAAGRAIP